MEGHPPASSQSTGERGNNSSETPLQATPRQDGSNATPAEAATISANPSARVRGPFALMVDAFISSFRQASNNGQVQTTSRGVSGQTSIRHSATDPSTAPIAEVTNQEMASEAMLGAQPQSQPATDTSEAETPAMQQSPPAHTPGNAMNADIADNVGTAPQDSDSASSNTTAANNTNSAQSPGTAENPAASETLRTIYFRIPLPNATGPSGILQFTPGPIPIAPHQPEPRPPYGPNRPPGLAADRGNGLASGFHMPSSPILVPRGSSPLPFSFIFDVQTNTAWPITSITTRPPGAMPTNEEEQFVAGLPFHIGLNISFGPAPQPELPDPERAARFVDSLERADAELRERMAQLSMGAIGDYGGRQDNEGGEGALGCGICLDEYPSEDRPEWIGGQASKDEEVVAVPCAGHHTLHRRCLYEWLAKTPPSEWTCPFCRAGLDKAKVDSSASNTTQGNDAVKKAEQDSKSRTLREEVRLREKARGWRCDSPACLLRYPCKDGDGTDYQADELVSLLPCRHKLHLDCLCTSMRLEQLDAFEPDCEEEDDDDDDAQDSTSIKEDAPAGDLFIDDQPSKNTVGKWVTCPTCRTEAWAELPMKKKRARRGKVVEMDEEEHESEALSQGVDHSSKPTVDVPLDGAREMAKLLDTQKSARVEDVADDDSDGAVETSLL
jgi:hypothetical protein